MKKEIPAQLIVALGIVLVGGGALAGESLLVKWLPKHRERVREETLQLLPYQNASLGVEMKIAAGIYGKVESFPGGVRIWRPKLWSIPPALTITSQPNPDGNFEFAPEVLAKWQTEGLYEEIPRYHFEHTKINNRDAVLIWQYQNRAMLLTVRVMSSQRIVEITCTPGREDEDLYMQACDESIHTLKVAGPEPPPPTEPILEMIPKPRRGR